MQKQKNVLFVMCDQLRADHLSCYGHPDLHTPNIDFLASRGVLFDRAFVQSGVCGPSRMSFYTGRYPSSHGAAWNFIPMPISERTLGDYMAGHGRDLHLIGKTHFEPDDEAKMLAGIRGVRSHVSLLEGGFTPSVRHEGDLPAGKADYRAWLNGKGYGGDDPWLEFANSGRLEDGSIGSGWQMRHAHLQANIAEEHSETAYVSGAAIRFIEQGGDTPWALHLSYIKPHWPYIAPAPYHGMYRHLSRFPVKRSRQAEGQEHPVVRAYRSHDESVAFSRPEVVANVRPTYMGLIKQIDDHLGRVLEALDRMGQMDGTVIVFTSDHGDFLGDYGMGEKELFYDVIQRVPLIIVDPSSAADATRGTRESRLVEAVDIVPTLLEALAMAPQSHRVEGRSLLPMLHGQECGEWRQAAISELDYSTRRARKVLGLDTEAICKGWMVRSHDWKLVVWPGFRPQLFDLSNDPDELIDLGAESGYGEVVEMMEKHLLRHLLGRKSRISTTHRQIDEMTDRHPPGIHIGRW